MLSESQKQRPLLSFSSLSLGLIGFIRHLLLLILLFTSFPFCGGSGFLEFRAVLPTFLVLYLLAYGPQIKRWETFEKVGRVDQRYQGRTAGLLLESSQVNTSSTWDENQFQAERAALWGLDINFKPIAGTSGAVFCPYCAVGD